MHERYTSRYNFRKRASVGEAGENPAQCRYGDPAWSSCGKSEYQPLYAKHKSVDFLEQGKQL